MNTQERVINRWKVYKREHVEVIYSTLYLFLITKGDWFPDEVDKNRRRQESAKVVPIFMKEEPEKTDNATLNASYSSYSSYSSYADFEGDYIPLKVVKHPYFAYLVHALTGCSLQKALSTEGLTPIKASNSQLTPSDTQHSPLILPGRYLTYKWAYNGRMVYPLLKSSPYKFYHNSSIAKINTQFLKYLFRTYPNLKEYSRHNIFRHALLSLQEKEAYLPREYKRWFLTWKPLKKEGIQPTLQDVSRFFNLTAHHLHEYRECFLLLLGKVNPLT